MAKEKRKRRKPGARSYADYSAEMLEVAANLVRDKVISSYEAEKQFGIPRRTIVNKSQNLHSKPFGRPTELSTEEEKHIAKVVDVSAEFGCPLTLLDLRIVVHNYLIKTGKLSLFKGKMPGERWAREFLTRHNFAQRATQNIKKSRSSKTVEELNEYFKNLETSLNDVPPSNILNFDETNLSDDPGSKKCIFKRGTKHPERVINTSKSSVSIMFSGTADGHCLPPYVVYKSDHLWSRWCEDGPKDARYNRTKSGWFDMVCFDDWFKTIVLPWANSRDGIKLIIGDNLASHLSVETIQLCQTHNIRFVFLPTNATHLTQPLDVAFFGPMKRHWRQILTNYKATYSTANTINKCHFPQLLEQLMTKINITKETNICKGFEGSGIYPFNPSRVMVKIPTVQEENTHQFDASLLKFLQQNRQSRPIKTGTLNKLTVVPGKSISTEEAEELAKAKKARKDAKKDGKKAKIDANKAMKDAKITNQKAKIDSNLPGPSKTRTIVREESIKHAEIKNSELEKSVPSSIDTYELDKENDSCIHNNLTQSQCLPSVQNNSNSLFGLCVIAVNTYLLNSEVILNNFVQRLKDVSKNSETNTPFYNNTPNCLQMKIVAGPNNNPEPSEKSNQKPKIIITSNIVINAASAEKNNILREISTEINKRKRRKSTTRKQSKICRKKRHVYNSDSSLTSQISFDAADTDDSEYENFDSYIESCLQEQEEQENVCPFGLSDIEFYTQDCLGLQEGRWVIAKFASKKSIKHFVGEVISMNDKIPTVKFARKVKNSKRQQGTVFTYPYIEDVFTVQDLNDIVAVLPDPQVSRRGHFIFNINFDKYNVQ
ncbi:uncharacterized protein LOC126374068 [Pectinophora gossypiella]|uniref:uncharacterized protein LOC126374068 n=1 Tax=Pectinophora gossypiella TaxID=13191 RepID=UPI00214F2F94|nr:uncharacterized protein LOC126374068 [Pectinophora gossypiella]